MEMTEYVHYFSVVVTKILWPKANNWIRSLFWLKNLEGESITVGKAGMTAGEETGWWHFTLPQEAERTWSGVRLQTLKTHPECCTFPIKGHLLLQVPWPVQTAPPIEDQVFKMWANRKHFSFGPPQWTWLGFNKHLYGCRNSDFK